MSDQKRANAKIIGEALAEVIPETDKYWFQIPHLLRLNLLLVVPLLSSSVSGYDGSLMNGLQALTQWKHDFGYPTGSTLGLVNAAQSLGSIASLPFVGTLADKLGRKPMLFIGIFGTCLASGVQAGSVNYGMFVASRVLVGFAAMFLVQPSAMLIAELSYPTHRGKYTSAFFTLYYLGAILASWTTFGTQSYAGPMAWRIPSILQGGLPIVQLCFLWLIPESPRWLVSKGRNEAAHTILRRFHDPTPDSPLVSFEMSEIIESIHKEKEAENTSWKALVSKPGNRKRTLIAVIVGWFAQWNGVAVVSYYLPLVLDSVGITSSFDQTLINGALQIFNFVAALGAAFLVDRLGRRTLFLWSTTGMLVSYIVWTACSAVTMETGNKAAGTVVVCVFVVYFHYDIAWTPLLYGYPTEIFPFSLRAKGLATEFFFNLAALVLASFVNPIGIANESWRYYIVFCCLLLFILCLIYFLFPETKGHSLEEIAVLFDGDDGQVSPLAEKGEEADHKERV